VIVFQVPCGTSSNPPAIWAAAAKPHNVSADCYLGDKDQMREVKRALVFDPTPAFPTHVRPRPFGSPQSEVVSELWKHKDRYRRRNDAKSKMPLSERASKLPAHRQRDADPDNWLEAGAVCAAALARVLRAIDRSEPECP
jgi:hypothetical protein